MSIRRREFITLLGGAAVAWPLAVRAQQSGRMRRIGVLIGFAEADVEAQARISALRQGLQELGWSEGRNIRTDYRFYTSYDPAGVRTLAAQLVDQTPDLVVAITGNSVRALLETSRTIPIVFVQIPDPVPQGFVASLAHPGGNVTGFTSFEYGTGSKWLEVLKEISPRIDHVTVVGGRTDYTWSGYLASMEPAAAALHVRLTEARVDTAAEIEAAIRSLAEKPLGGLVALPNPVATQNVELITMLSARYQIPSVYPYRYFVTRGGLISYGIDNHDLFRRAATYVDRILKGEKAADLPVQFPTKYELAINIKTAKALGLDVSVSLQQRADEVVE